MKQSQRRPRSFEEVLPRGGTTERLVEVSRGAAFGDLDNDGGIDVIVVNSDAAVHVLRNIVGSRNHWIKFRVINHRGGHALGAAVKIRVGDADRWQHVQRAYSYASSNDPRVHFGLGNATSVEEVLVRWPGGQTQTFGPFNCDAIHELRRDE